MNKLSKIFLTALLLMSAGVIVLQVPALTKTHNTAYDEKTAADLQSIYYAVSSYSSSSGKLPQTLNDLKIGQKLTHTVSSYEYRVSGESTYELCATFKTKSDGSQGGVYPAYDAQSTESESMIYPPIKSNYPNFYAHERARHCFSLTDPYLESKKNNPVDPTPLPLNPCYRLELTGRTSVDCAEY